jgi:hypothetical protein
LADELCDQDCYGVGPISTQINQLLPWRTRLWDDNLQFVDGIQRIYAGDIAPNDQYFVVGSGSSRDRPPINDTAAGPASFSVRATDEIGLTTSSTNQGRLTINAQVAWDAFPDDRLNFTVTDGWGKAASTTRQVTVSAT